MQVAEDLRESSTRPLCTEKGCQTYASWRQMHLGMPTGVNLCTGHGPDEIERTRRDHPGGLVWKRC